MIYYIVPKDELYHHGIKGQTWGVRNGPPYPLSGGQFSGEEVKYKQRNYSNKKLQSKRFNDLNLEKGLELATLSYDPNRTKDTDMFYATFNKKDRHLYEALFNKPIPQTIVDSDGNELGTGMFLKYRITNEVKDDIKCKQIIGWLNYELFITSWNSGSEVGSKTRPSLPH